MTNRELRIIFTVEVIGIVIELERRTHASIVVSDTYGDAATLIQATNIVKTREKRSEIASRNMRTISDFGAFRGDHDQRSQMPRISSGLRGCGQGFRAKLM